MAFIDISLPLRTGAIPRWPGDRPFRHSWVRRFIDGDQVNVSEMELCVHAGTHIDAPLHHIDGAEPVGAVAFDDLIGLAQVVEFGDAVDQITATHLDEAGIPPDTRRLLLKTRNCRIWERGETEFRTDYVAISPCGAQWLVERGIRLVGIDYLSVEDFHAGTEVHRTLLGARIIVVESLDLRLARPGFYELICLPLNLPAAEAAPVRAVLRELEGK